MDEGIFIIRARRCQRCGRLLTSEEALKTGYGCNCKLKAAREEQEKEPIPGQMTITDFLEKEETTNEQHGVY